MKFSFHAVGDSHVKYFQFSKEARSFPRAGFDRDRIQVKTHQIRAASVMGFRPKKSKLNSKETIESVVNETDALVLNFGQVDLELGYYYRKAIKGETDLDDAQFIDELLDIYMNFLTSFKKPRAQFIVKGVNLTVLGHRAFTFEYGRRIIIEETGAVPDNANAVLKKALKTEEEQNRMHIAFNRGLKERAKLAGFVYFDVMDATGVKDPTGALRLADWCSPSRFDHHMVNSLAMQRLHIVAVLKALEMNPADVMLNGFEDRV